MWLFLCFFLRLYALSLYLLLPNDRVLWSPDKRAGTWGIYCVCVWMSIFLCTWSWDHSGNEMCVSSQCLMLGITAQPNHGQSFPGLLIWIVILALRATERVRRLHAVARVRKRLPHRGSFWSFMMRNRCQKTCCLITFSPGRLFRHLSTDNLRKYKKKKENNSMKINLYPVKKGHR